MWNLKTFAQGQDFAWRVPAIARHASNLRLSYSSSSEGGQVFVVQAALRAMGLLLDFVFENVDLTKKVLKFYTCG
jgi:hypothetical protein